MQRLVPIVLFLGCIGMISSSAQAQSGQGQPPPLEILKQLVPAHKAISEELFRYKSWQIDLNGDGKKEWLLVENPNKKKKSIRKANQCRCPKVKPKGKKAKRIFNMLRKRKDSIYELKVHRKRGRRQLTIWYASELAKRSHDKMMKQWCMRLGRRYTSWRRYRIRRFVLIDIDTGKAARISAKRCRSMYRASRRGRRNRRQKRVDRIWERYRKGMDQANIKTCACPKKKPGAQKPKTRKPLFVTVARTLAPKKGSDTGMEQNKLKVIGRFRGENVQPVALTVDGKIIGLRIEQTKQLTQYSPRVQLETLYIYDAGKADQMKSVFSIETAKSNLDRSADARRWTSLAYKNMDSDAWVEIVADTYYETPQFNGMVRRTMYKWYQGRYVTLNKYRGIHRATASSTWKKVTTQGSASILRRVSQRVLASNLIDGFRNTSWVSGRMNRGLRDSVRVEFYRNQKLIGLAIAVQKPQTPIHVVRSLYTGRAPALVPPRYLRIETGSGFKMDVEVDPMKKYNFYRFPTPVFTRFVKIKLLKEYKDQSGKRHRVVVPKGERSLGFISEILPVEDRVRYTSSSFEHGAGTSFVASNIGDKRKTTGWAEGRKDDGIGEWVQMIFPTPRTLRTINIVNGCKRPGEKFILNNRVKEVLLTFSNGMTRTVTLKDTNKTQKIKVGSVRTLSVKLTIQSFYKGKIGHTTCLSEVHAN
ncbi:MAG TPA: hypothetical protein DCE42_03575 [Myxococcales bacterium]|nr:hypothetical protein [Deltaproteobacteria bacterium]HAA53804.1 hypothetical protein [Myxococcales bacterium]|tara:strand:- start:17108 stop:19210 length:2103 start_codon:yes stop_codon:yes gene_type:complete